MTAGEDSDLVCEDLIDEAVLPVYAPRPTAGEVSFERLGLPNAFERIALNGLNQLDNTKSLLPVLLNPIGQILERGQLKYQASLGLHRKECPPVAVGLP